MEKYIEGFGRHGDKLSWLRWFSPPSLPDLATSERFMSQERLIRAYVQHREFLDWNGTLHEVGSQRVLEIPLR